MTAPDRPGTPDSRSTLWPCCKHCIDGDGMLPCYNFHDEPCGDCAWTDGEIAEWRKGLQL